MKRNIVNPDLTEERAKLAFDRVELQKFTLGEWLYDKFGELDGFMAENPELLGSADDYEMTREELIEHYWKKVKIISEKGDEYISNNSSLIRKGFMWSFALQNLSPLILHQSMFTQCMIYLTSDEQRKKYLPLCDSL